MIIEDYKAIATRQRQIAIEEGLLQCPRCKSEGWHEYCDDEGAIYFTECETCGNPQKMRAPTATRYCG